MKKLEIFRKEIDAIDDEIIKKLIERMKLSEKVKNFKKENSVDIFDVKREKYIYDKISKNEFYSDYLIEIYEKIIELSKNIQKK